MTLLRHFLSSDDISLVLALMRVIGLTRSSRNYASMESHGQTWSAAYPGQSITAFPTNPPSENLATQFSVLHGNMTPQCGHRIWFPISLDDINVE